MTQEDKLELKEILKEYIHSVIIQQEAKSDIQEGKVASQFDNIKLQLDQLMDNLIEVKEQTFKTNGRVTALELKTTEHITTCPVIPRVRIIEDKLLSKQAISKFIIITLGIVSTFLGIIIAILTIGNKI